MDDLRGVPVVVTGAGGWLGRAALELAHAKGATLHAFGSTERTQTVAAEAITVRPLTALADLHIENALVLHTAFLTREHAGENNYAAKNREISATVETFIHRNGARGVFVPSSGAVYAPPPNPYGEGKLEDEARFAALGVPCVAIRVFNLAGPFINKLESYALACILRDLLAKRPVTLRAAHPVWRGYAHVNDVLRLALGLLLRGVSPPVFDSFGEPVELSDLAARAARLLNKPLTLHRPEWQNGAPDFYLGDAAAFLEHASSIDLEPTSLDQQILDTASYLGRCFAM